MQRIKVLSKSLSKLGFFHESNLLLCLIKEADSQGNISTLLGYPKEVADWFQKKFGKYSFLMAKWAKELYDRGRGDFLDNITLWIKHERDYPKKTFGTFSLKDLFAYRELLTKLQSMHNMEEIKNLLKTNGRRLGLDWENENDSFIDGAIESQYEFITRDFISRIEDFFEWFLNQDIVKAVLSGKINLNEYKKLSLPEAVEKFNAKQLDSSEGFPTVMNLDGGWRWIAVGPKCQWVGNKMENCGSTGIYSEYEGGKELTIDKTILVLVDPANDPHLLLTYSANANYINAVEGKHYEKYPKIEYLQRLKPLYEMLGKPRFGKSMVSVIEKYLNGDIDLVRRLGGRTYSGVYLARNANGELYIADSWGGGGDVLPEEALNWSDEKIGEWQIARNEEKRAEKAKEKKERGY